MSECIETHRRSAWPGRLFALVLFALVFSGFGQMPIFKRYYLADIPGLEWTADFHVTLIIHYVAAAVFLAVVFYKSAEWLLARREPFPTAWKARARAFLFAVLTVSGAALVWRNLPGTALSPALVVASTLTHIAGTMAFLGLAALSFLARR